jgi:hypothetical protein
MRPPLFPALFDQKYWLKSHFDALIHATSLSRDQDLNPVMRRVPIRRDPQNHYINYLNRTRSSELAHALMKIRNLLGDEFIEINLLIRGVDVEFSNRHGKTGKECFIYKTGNFSPLFQTTEVSRKQWGELSALFSDGGPLREADELAAIKQATRTFEAIVPHYGNDIGGWTGNLSLVNFLLRKNATACTDEAYTYKFFLETLDDHGLLLHHQPQARLAHRGKLFPFYHFGVLLGRKSDGATLVVDSWQRHGGNPAKIYYLDDWQKSRDGENI